MHSETIDYQDGDTRLEGYVTWDDSISGPRPAVLVRQKDQDDYCHSHSVYTVCLMMLNELGSKTSSHGCRVVDRLRCIKFHVSSMRLYRYISISHNIRVSKDS